MTGPLRLSPLKLGAAAALVVAGILLVLYGIVSGPVHALPDPPRALERLKPAERPKKVPDVAFSDAEGRIHNLREFRGRYVVLNLWATWCAPCVRELPALSKLKMAMGATGVEVLAINVGRSTMHETVLFLANHGARALAPYLDSRIALVRSFGAYGLPLTVVLDPAGREVARALGPSRWDDPDAITYFKTLARSGRDGAVKD